MALSVSRCLETITAHSRGLAADATAAGMRKQVEHCPEWRVADLVWHVADVHWFWRTIVAERLDGPPEEIRRPVRPPDDEVVDVFLAGADTLVDILANADQSAACWTWYPPQQDVAFVTRHQVQEAVVHHFDAAHAAGVPLEISTDVAVDSIEEFLTVSLADDDDAARLSEDQGLELADELVLHATDTDQTWTVYQSGRGALLWTPDGPVSGSGEPTVTGTAAELLLWIYGRVPLEATKPNLVRRFRRMSSTD